MFESGSAEPAIRGDVTTKVDRSVPLGDVDYRSKVSITSSSNGLDAQSGRKHNENRCAVESGAKNDYSAVTV